MSGAPEGASGRKAEEERRDAHPAVGVGLFLLLVAAGWILAALLLTPLPDTAMPWRQILAALLGVWLATWTVLRWLEAGGFGVIGLEPDRRAVRYTGLGIVGGSVLFAAGFGLVAVGGGVRFVPDAGTAQDYAGALAAMLVFFGLAAAAEEILFRGYALQVLRKAWGPVAAVGVTSVLFALAHAGNPEVTVLALVNIFLAGVLLGIAVVRSGSLWLATGIHAGWNWAMAGVFDVPVSGLTAGFDTPLYSVTVGEPAWWTGGDFGPEGGVAALIVLGGGTVWLARTRRLPEEGGRPVGL